MTLDELLIKYGSDKSSKHHNYSPIYEKWFSPLKEEAIILLEIGIGAYNKTDQGGHSLRAWKEYFPLGVIHGVDIYDKKAIEEHKITTHMGSEGDGEFLEAVIFEIGAPDIIINDGSHNNPLRIKNFEILFQHLKRGGIFVVEDTHTSYWDSEEYQGGGDLSSNLPNTTTNYFKMLTDLLNKEHLPKVKSIPWWMEDIESIHFYKQLIIILKK